LERLRPDVDETVCLQVSADFGAVGAFYRNFEQVTDQQVAELLKLPPS
jgi:putative phosphoribosyl transferase